MEIGQIAALAFLIAVVPIFFLYFAVVGERIKSMYFEGMMWNERVASNHSKKLHDLFIWGVKHDASVEARLQEYDTKAPKAWDLIGKHYPEGFEYRIWEPTGNLLSKDEIKIVDWSWDEGISQDDWAEEIH
jgi:hypothetical protein